MKTTLKKILFISLLFSATVPSSTVQANLDLAALRSGAIEIVSFLRENPIVVGVGVVGIAVFVWKMLKEKAMTDGFFLAVENNNIEEVKQALANGTNVDVQNKYGDTALIKATDMGHFEIVKLLLENNALVNKENNDDLTALMKAAIRGHSKIVKSLLTSGADVNHSDLLGYTALMGAASGGHSKVVELLLATKKIDINRSFKKGGWTALMFVANREKNLIDPEEKQKSKNIIDQFRTAGADLLVRKQDDTTVNFFTVLEQGDNETINEYMREKILGPLKEAVVALPGSLELPNDIATLTSEFTY